MKKVLACLAALTLTGSALAGSFTTGAAFRHYSHVAGCGTPISGVTWTANKATQRFQRCTLRAIYQTVGPTRTPTPRPTATPLPTWTPLPTPTAWTWPTPIPTATQPVASTPEQYLLNLINASRAQAGLRPYALDTAENPCSLAHSEHMAAVGYISHDQFPADICVPYYAAGENVGMSGGDAYSAAQTIHQLMMAEGPSGGHYQNLMSTTYTKVGLGIYVSSGSTWLTEDFTA